MYRDGHYGLALLVYAPLSFLLISNGHLGHAVFWGGIFLGLSTLPDIDHRIPGISHRGITHSVWFAAFVGIVVYYLVLTAGAVAPQYEVLATAEISGAVAAAAVVLHILGDSLTPMGIRPFVPVVDSSFSFGLFRSANWYVNKGLLLSGIVATLASAF